MNGIEIFLIALGLSMDSFSVAVCLGLGLTKLRIKDMFTVGIYFGVFQGSMPVIGYFLGKIFENQIKTFDHWLIFALLLFIGGKMIFESFGRRKEDVSVILTFKKLVPLAFATSVDALAVGLSFGLLNVNIGIAASVIAVVTLVASMAGVKIGAAFGKKFHKRAELCGGLILIGLGIKILLEHLNII